MSEATLQSLAVASDSEPLRRMTTPEYTAWKRERDNILRQRVHHCPHPGCRAVWYSEDTARDCHRPLTGLTAGRPQACDRINVRALKEDVINTRIRKNELRLAWNEYDRNWRIMDRENEEVSDGG